MRDSGMLMLYMCSMDVGLRFTRSILVTTCGESCWEQSYHVHYQSVLDWIWIISLWIIFRRGRELKVGALTNPITNLSSFGLFTMSMVLEDLFPFFCDIAGKCLGGHQPNHYLTDDLMPNKTWSYCQYMAGCMCEEYFQLSRKLKKKEQVTLN